MTVLTGVFLKLLSQGMTAVPVICAVLLLRLLLFRAPRKYSYLLWAAVGFRLLCPVTVSSPLSLFNLRPMEPVAARTTGNLAGGLTSVDYGTAAAAAGQTSAAPVPAASLTVPSAAHGTEMLARISAAVWLLGLLALLTWGIVSYLRLRRQVAPAVRLRENIYEADGLKTPFVLGFFRPRIYLPFHVPEEEQRWILLHEQIHIRRRDYLVKLLAFALLAVYWFHPLVWLSYFLLCRDMELSCDEAVLRKLGTEVKKPYSLSLVSFASARRLPSASPLAFGETDAKRRVVHVLHWKRVAPGVAFLALVLCVFMVLSLCTNAFVNKSYLENEGPLSAAGLQISRFSYYCPKEVRTIALVREIYDEGTLVESTPMTIALRDEAEDGVTDANVLSRQGTMEYAVTLDNRWKSLTWRRGEKGSGMSVGSELPEHSYQSACETSLGENDAGRRIFLASDSNTVLVAEYISYAPDGGIGSVPCETLTKDISQGFQKSVVLAVLRLVLSTSDAEATEKALSVTEYARDLYALRNPYVGDMPADGELLSALGIANTVGPYKTELFTSQEPYVLQLDFQQKPDDPNAADTSMKRNAMLLLALIDNLSEVRWNWPDGTEVHAGSCSAEDADALLKLSSTTILQGRTGIKNFSVSPGDVQDLLDFLSS
jgi:beta-lactamase regulating signal transducer with metallopeptidase domain